MIYIVIGPSCGGKSTLVVNSFLKGKTAKEFKDILTVCETDNAYLVGKWFDERRVKGLDRISRAQISKITEQVKRLLARGSRKTLFWKGTKLSPRKYLKSW